MKVPIVWWALLLLMQPARSLAAVTDVTLPLQPGVYNPSMVIHQGSGWLVARLTTKMKAKNVDASSSTWLIHRAYLCQVTIGDWSLVSCHDFDPWRGAYGNQCRWELAAWDFWGVDDTKLFRWPGRGVWAITGRQWLVQLAPEGQPMDPLLFDYPPTKPVNVTFYSKFPDSWLNPSGMAHHKRRHLLGESFGQSVSSNSLGDPRNSSSSSSSSTNSSVVGPSHSLRYRYGIRRYRSPVAGHVRPGHGTVLGDNSSIPQATAAGRPRRMRRRRRWRNPPILLAMPHNLQQPLTLTVQISATQTQTNLNMTNHSPQANRAVLEPSTTGAMDTARLPDWDSYWGHTPVPLAISDAGCVYGREPVIWEKNWMPFIWNNQMYVTYTPAPKHRVYLLHPNGSADLAYETDSGAEFAHLGSTVIQSLRGGPPLVYVDYPRYIRGIKEPEVRAATEHQEPYYLGVVHYMSTPDTLARTYHHFLYKMQATPPFNILQVSSELPLRRNGHKNDSSSTNVAFVSGLELAMLPLELASDNVLNGNSSGHTARGSHSSLTAARAVLQQPDEEVPHILMSYGLGDRESHVAVMTIEDVEVLFKGKA